MTTLYAAHRTVESEIIERIESIVPVAQKSFRFKHYSDANEAASPIEQFTGRPRMFRLRPSIKEAAVAACAGSYREIRIMPLLITYPVDNYKGGQWDALAADDYNQIRADLLNNASSTNGVGYRIIRPDSQPTFEKYADDPWHLMRVGIEIYFDVTTS